MKKLWGGRFSDGADAFAESFGASIHFDHILAPFDIQGSIAHATMLGEAGIVTTDEASQIVEGLRRVRARWERGELEFRVSDEDIHMNIERYLTEEIGPVAGKLHTARSRNDQVATDLHLYIRAQILHTLEGLTALCGALIAQAEANKAAILPGYTHLQRAQPVLFAHHLLAYVAMFQRDSERFRDLWKRVNVLPLGAGALAGTTFPINRERVAELLRFDSVYENSMDAVSDRDFALEYLNCCSLVMMHLSRLGEEVVLWSTGEFGFVELSDKFSTGSSIMPQKKNADFAELVRGKTGRVYGSLTALYTTLKGLPLAYNKDMQEDKECVFDATDTVLGSLTVVAPMIATLKINSQTMREHARRGFTNATDAADYLAKKGLPFREAHEVVGKLVRHCIEARTDLDSLPLESFKGFSPLFERDIFDAIALETVVNRRTARGGTGLSAVEEQIARVQDKILEGRQWIEQHQAMLATVR
jgi:argininosuccinate lyase